MTEVPFRGEWVEKSHANVVLERENNSQNPEYHIKQREEAEAKAAQEERKKQIQQKRIDTQSRNKKIEELLQKHREELPPGAQWSETESIRQRERAYNEYETELRKEEFRRRQAEEQRLMEQESKKRIAEKEQKRKDSKTFAARQYQMILSGKHDYREPGLKVLAKEYSTGQLTRYDDQTHNRRLKFAKPGEDPVELENRLLDIAEKAEAAAKQRTG